MRALARAMRRWPGLALCSALGLAGCAKTIPTRAVSDGFGFCKGLTEGEPFACVAPSKRFAPTDPAVVYRMEFENAVPAAVLRCEWIDPSDEPYLRSGALPLTAGTYSEHVVQACILPLNEAPPAMFEGRWKLRVYYDGGPRTRAYNAGLLRDEEFAIGG